MNMKLLAVSSLAVMGLTAASANAATCVGNTCTQGGETVTISAQALPFSSTLTAAGLHMIDDFDSISPASGFTVSTTGSAGIHTTSDSNNAAPPGDGTGYMSINNGGSFTITDTSGFLSQFSFYMGSPDNFNNLTLTINGGLGPISLQGTQVWGGSPAGDGNQSEGFLVTYVFTPNQVTSLTFSSTGNSFEFDNLAAGVPEPATWALMIMGFGTAGAMLRRRKAVMA